MLEWLKTVLGDAYTPEIDTAVSQEIGKGFVARTDFNTKTAKVTELETEVKQLRDFFLAQVQELQQMLHGNSLHHSSQMSQKYQIAY